MRIIAGTLRSRRLKTVEGEGYRPAMGKVRESLFSMLSSRLGSFEGLDVLDLFAVALYEGGSCAHTYHYHTLKLAFVSCTESIGNKLFALRCRQTIDSFINVSRTYTGEHNLFYLVEANFVVV